MHAKNLAELNNTLPILEWVVDKSLLSGVLAEQVDPYTGAPLSVSPLTWSHAAFVTTLMKYMENERSSFCAPDAAIQRFICIVMSKSHAVPSVFPKKLNILT